MLADICNEIPMQPGRRLEVHLVDQSNVPALRKDYL
jgi:hypothetical protein